MRGRQCALLALTLMLFALLGASSAQYGGTGGYGDPDYDPYGYGGEDDGPSDYGVDTSGRGDGESDETFAPTPSPTGI